MKGNLTLVKIGLVLATLAGLSYGITLLLTPGIFVTISGSEPVEPAWVRWAGGSLIAVSIGALMVLRHLAGQDLYVKMLILYNAMTALGHLISLIVDDFSGAIWIVILPMILTIAIAVILWLGRQQAIDVLQAK